MDRAGLATVLRRAATKRGWYGVNVAERCGLPASSVRRVLRGDNAKLETIETVANALGYELRLVPIRGSDA